MIDASAIRVRYERLKANRQTFESEWTDIVKYIYPNSSRFWRTANQTKGETLRNYMVDQTAERASGDLVSFIIANTCAIGTNWVSLRPEDPKLYMSQSVMTSLDTRGRAIENYLQQPERGFHLAYQEAGTEWADLGNGIVYVREDDDGLYFESVPLEECYFVENYKNKIDVLFRSKFLTAKQILEEYDLKNNKELDNDQYEALKDKVSTDPSYEYKVLHAVFPRDEDEYVKNSIDPKKYKFASVHIALEGFTSTGTSGPLVLKESGYKRFPYMVFRFDKRSGEPYGRGAGHRVIYDVRSLNKMRRTNLEAGEVMVTPPMDVPHGLYPNKLNLSAKALNYRKSIGMSASGRGDRAEPILSIGNLPITLEMEQEMRAIVKEGFYVDRISETKNAEMSATESNIRQSERLGLMTPQITRLVIEFLNPVVEYVSDYMEENGLFTEPLPMELEDRGISPVFISALVRAQSANEVGKLGAAVNALAPFAAVDPNLQFAFKTDGLPRLVIEKLGLPFTMLETSENVAAKVKSANEAQQMNLDSQTIKNTAGAAKDYAAAAQLAGL